MHSFLLSISTQIEGQISISTYISIFSFNSLFQFRNFVLSAITVVHPLRRHFLKPFLVSSLLAIIAVLLGNAHISYH